MLPLCKFFEAMDMHHYDCISVCEVKYDLDCHAIFAFI